MALGVAEQLFLRVLFLQPCYIEYTYSRIAHPALSAAPEFALQTRSFEKVKIALHSGLTF
jgi:hypothetical protein